MYFKIPDILLVEEYFRIYFICTCKIPDKTDSSWKWQEKPNQYSDQISWWPRNSESFLIRILFKMTTEFFWNSSRISIRILVASLSIQPFKWLLRSWRIRWPRNSCEILQGFDNFKSRIPVASLSIQQFRWLLNSSKARWPQNSYKIILGFWSEFCWFILKMTNLRIRKLDDHGILMKF